MAACTQFAYVEDPAPLLAAGGLRLRASAGCAILAVGAGVAVLAFRGTNCLADWRRDLSAELEQLPGAAAGVRVHRGFRAGFQADRARARPPSSWPTRRSTP